MGSRICSWTVLAVGLFAAACGSEGSGSVQIFVVPEETIRSGIAAGAGPEDIHDGWSVTYDRFLVTVGGFRAGRSDTGESLATETAYVLDLVHAPSSGYVVVEWTDVPAVRWDRFGYDVPNARAARGLEPTTPADVDFMQANGYSVYFEGMAADTNHQIRFGWGFRAGTAFDDCASSDGIAGFAVPSGGTIQVKPTVHGDHHFFDNVTQGVEYTERLAGWVAICDADADFELTTDELRSCDVVLALPTPPYDLTGVRDEDGDGFLSVYDFVQTQTRTLGDFQGDGECPTRSALP